ncbi:fasciclin-like arabinogalactan protein 14 [Brachypodium distachyon]|uniref:FAS1 domain-containing protein n=1 Tax=Brachypodium distachyon TaxID=15368 RepID=A0A0Q3H1S2_BRADI|nr:fasciclin-like arabinogalactan protein 14 [Brachypodium distachyon]KQJ82011.1 hypothetical protein BRADI_5g04846v3 [Brachypodium distachyon]|eukprot:XP_003581094.1 fasciclin-like arabinogalactan protein 14 [Brachypodium distachyon]
MASPWVTTTTALLLLLTLASFSNSAKFNITEIISESPEFKTFNSLLSKTKVAEEINARQDAITVLVVDDKAAGAITALPADTQKKVLAVHVILDYYDPMKLDSVHGKTAMLTTLFQTTGAAADSMGLIKYTQGADEQMSFASAEPGSSASSQLVKVVACRPYNLSVMQVSAAIIPPGIGKGLSGSGNGSSSPTISGPETPPLGTEAIDADAPDQMPDYASDQDVDGPSSPAEPSPTAKSDKGTTDSLASAGNKLRQDIMGTSSVVGIMGALVMFVIW